MDFIHRLVSEDQKKHQAMDKVHKHNSINTNTPLSESYRSDFRIIYSYKHTDMPS
jgi:hypothetical protein